jgi:ubiquinone/menaquinone biosynthesis C-methylase UbiE
MRDTLKNAYSDIETASRYDSARNLPAETMTLWLAALQSSLPEPKVKKILDLGCGTGRFTAPLGQAFACSVIGVEPASAMLDIARAQHNPNVEWKQGAAESIPLENESVDLVFMSQVFHHLAEPQPALREIHRVLTAEGYLAIRNSIREHNQKLDWLRFFPAALAIEEKRLRSRLELEESVSRQSFALIAQHTIAQLFAESYEAYLEKISQRGLSALIAISDAAFQSGLQEFQAWISEQPRELQVYEPVDLFVFQKKSM